MAWKPRIRYTSELAGSAPVYVTEGAFLASLDGYAAAWPVGHRAGDIGLIVVQSANQAHPAAGDGPFGGWTAVPLTPVGTGTAGAAGATRLTVYWRRAASADETPVFISDSGDHQMSRIVVIRGCRATGSPVNVSAVGTAASATAVSVPGATTTVGNCLVVALVAHATDTNTAQFTGSPVNGTLNNITLRLNLSSNVGVGGGFAVITGIKVAAGSYSATTGNLLTASPQALVSLALEPPLETVVQLVHMSGLHAPKSRGVGSSAIFGAGIQEAYERRRDEFAALDITFMESEWPAIQAWLAYAQRSGNTFYFQFNDADALTEKLVYLDSPPQGEMIEPVRGEFIGSFQIPIVLRSADGTIFNYPVTTF